MTASISDHIIWLATFNAINKEIDIRTWKEANKVLRREEDTRIRGVANERALQ